MKKILVDMVISWFPLNFMMLKFLTNISKKELVEFPLEFFSKIPNYFGQKGKTQLWCIGLHPISTLVSILVKGWVI